MAVEMKNLRYAFIVMALAAATAMAWTLAAAQAGGEPVVVMRDKIYDVKFVGEREAWAVGYPGLLLHTTDGGESWRKFPVDTRDALYALDFVEGGYGWVVGRAGLLLLTTDKGQTWQKKEPLCSEPLFDVDFVDAQHGVTVGYFGQIHTTSDGGQTWRAQTLAMMQSASINAVSMLSPLVGYIAGEAPLFEMDYNPDLTRDMISNVFKTTDGGVTWQVVPTHHFFTLYDAYFESPEKGWVAGAEGSLLATEDGGTTWRILPIKTNSHLLKLCKSVNGIWAVGTEGAVFRIVGDQPTAVSVGAYNWLSSIAFFGARGIIVGGGGAILSSADDGQNWKLFPIKR
jgi:photosystem II stability/assembly factor-like uncharacterized protein